MSEAACRSDDLSELMREELVVLGVQLVQILRHLRMHADISHALVDRAERNRLSPIDDLLESRVRWLVLMMPRRRNGMGRVHMRRVELRSRVGRRSCQHDCLGWKISFLRRLFLFDGFNLIVVISWG
jgi:hypothetical protein